MTQKFRISFETNRTKFENNNMSKLNRCHSIKLIGLDFFLINISPSSSSSSTNYHASYHE